MDLGFIGFFLADGRVGGCFFPGHGCECALGGGWKQVEARLVRGVAFDVVLEKCRTQL